MKTQLNHIGIGTEDVSDVLELIEKRLNIRFGDNELEEVKTFGELCDIILSKINLPQKDDCTSQQAFYKLRKAIAENIAIDKSLIKPKSILLELFSNNIPLDKIRSIENSLGFRLNILRIKRSVILIISIGIVLALLGAFVNVMYGVIVAAFVLVYIAVTANKIKAFKVATVGDVVEIMTRDNYFKSRRDVGTINRKEVRKLLERYFLENLATDLKEINRDTIIA